MFSDSGVLLTTAVSIGLVHTVLGPDHYLPFIMLSRARGWKLGKTALITSLCGLGHVLGSVILGILGVTLGIALGFLEEIEAVRGDIAAWLIIGLGVAYAVWGLRIGLRAGEHSHDHLHEGETHSHSHHHLSSHAHIHGDSHSLTPWALFIIFVLGPCEPLIPVLMYPAAQGSWGALAGVTLAFGLTTVATMVVIVTIMSLGMVKIRLGIFERYAHVLAGVIIAVSGLSIKLLGL